MADKRVTMIKPVVGKVKSPSYALPENQFVYGMVQSGLDKEGAGEGECAMTIGVLQSQRGLILLLSQTAVVQSWARSKSSEPPCSMQSFPATNRQALKNGCLTSKSQREYGKYFPVMKQNPKQSIVRQGSKDDLQENAKIGEVITSIYQESTQPRQPEKTFGIQNKRNKVSMTELLRCIPTELDDEMDYPDLGGKKRHGRLPPAKPTKSSLIVAQCREPPSEEEMAKRKSVDEFKMKKFRNVQPRVKCYM